MNYELSNDWAERQPAVEQLDSLAALCIKRASDQGGLVQGRLREGLQFFTSAVTYGSAAASQSMLQEQRLGVQLWEQSGQSGTVDQLLNVHDVLWVDLLNGARRGEKTEYNFRWNDQTVQLAKRSFTRLVRDQRPALKAMNIDDLKLADDTSTIWGATADIERVTTEDCGLLAAQVADFFDSLQLVDEFHGKN